MRWMVRRESEGVGNQQFGEVVVKGGWRRNSGGSIISCVNSQGPTSLAMC